MKPKKKKDTAPAILRKFKDLTSKKNPRGGHLALDTKNPDPLPTPIVPPAPPPPLHI
jgi:hypothetical protein